MTDAEAILGIGTSGSIICTTGHGEQCDALYINLREAYKTTVGYLAC